MVTGSVTNNPLPLVTVSFDPDGEYIFVYQTDGICYRLHRGSYSIRT